MRNKDMSTMDVRNMDVRKRNLLDTLDVFVRRVKRKKMKIFNTNSSLAMAFGLWWRCRRQLLVARKYGAQNTAQMYRGTC